tara:strand:+ start:984 stop:1223 length:240 start_codon:yes stop_codon:yes gene_type:complete
VICPVFNHFTANPKLVAPQNTYLFTVLGFITPIIDIINTPTNSNRIYKITQDLIDAGDVSEIEEKICQTRASTKISEIR